MTHWSIYRETLYPAFNLMIGVAVWETASSLLLLAFQKIASSWPSRTGQYFFGPVGHCFCWNVPLGHLLCGATGRPAEVLLILHTPRLEKPPVGLSCFMTLQMSVYPRCCVCLHKAMGMQHYWLWFAAFVKSALAVVIGKRDVPSHCY